MKGYTGKSQVEYFFVGFLKGRNYFRDIGDVLYFSTIRATQLTQRLGKIQKPIKIECLPFPTHSHRFFKQDMTGI